MDSVPIITSVFICEVAVCIYGLIRNKWVYNWRTKILKESKFINGKYIPYDNLPPYDEMLEGHGFWIWDINYYIKRAKSL